METIESFIARGGRVQVVPTGAGKAQVFCKQRRGDRLRKQLDAEAQQFRARRNGGGK